MDYKTTLFITTRACRPVNATLAVALALVVAAVPLPAQSGSSISGVVFDQSRQPVAKIWMELLDEVDAIVQRTRTDGSGRYGFYRLSNGVFQVRVVTFGTIFAQQTERVNLAPSWINRGTRSVIEQLDFHLRPARSQSPATPVAGTLFAQEVPDAARKAYDAGIALLEEKSDSEAGIARLKEAIEISPTYYMALERLGVEYVRRGEFEPAIAFLAEAIRVNPGGQGSHYALGVAQYRLKRHGEAAESLRRMISLAPNAPNAPYAYYFLGLSLVRGGNPQEAEAPLRRAYEQGGTTVPPDVHMALAKIYSDSRRYKEAADELEQFLREAPDARDAEKVREIARQLREKQR